MLKINDKLTVEIIDYGFNGEGIAKCDGFVILIPFSVISEIVEIEIIDLKKNFATGKILNILKPSKDRISPYCPYFGLCGGCQLQHIKYEETLRIKQNAIKNTFRRIAKTDCLVSKPVSSGKIYDYRNKVSLPIIDGRVCMYRYNKKEGINIDCCPIGMSELNEIIKLFNQYLNTVDSKLIRHLVVRKIDNKFLICIVSSGELENPKTLIKIFSKFPYEIGVYHNLNKLHNSQIFSDNFKFIYGIKEIIVYNYELSYPVGIESFMQVNSFIEAKLYKEVLRYVQYTDLVINAYSGAGVLSAILAKKCKKVYGIELNVVAHKKAEKLKDENIIQNLVNICGDCKKILKNIPAKPDVIVIDPPRSGVSDGVIQTLKNLEVKTIIYISCEPSTLARDFARLKENYHISTILPFDMFPQTSKVETLAVLIKN